MKNFVSMLIIASLISLNMLVPANSDAETEYIAGIVSSQYSGMRRKAKGDKSKLAKLAKIRTRALKKISRANGYDAKEIAAAAIKDMGKVVK